MRALWERFFEDHDAILMPVHPRPAIRHDHSEPQMDRTIEVDGVERPYLDLFAWIAPAGLAYLPATVIPVGLSGAGLPIGVQVVGPHLEDRTTLEVARMVERVVGPIPHPARAV
jgi:amidase